MKDGWITKTLGEACEVIAGQSPAGSAYNLDGKGLPFYQGKKEFEDKYVGSPTTWTTEVTKRAKANDILMSVRAPVGPINFATQEVCIGRGLAAIRAKSGLDQNFLFYFLLSIQSEISGRDGAVFPSISRNEICAIALSIPELAEQKRIVAILDGAFAGLATATANAEKNLKNTRELFDRQLDFVFAQGGQGWVKRRLEDLFDIGSSKRIRETDWTSSGVPFYGGKEIVRLAKHGFAVSNAYISEEKFQEYSSKYDMPRKGDVLITARGTIGVGYVVKEGDRFYYKDGNIIALREKTPTNPLFILYAFRSKSLLKQFSDLKGATVTHLPIERAKILALNIPSFGDQNSVVQHLVSIESETQRLAGVYHQKLAALGSLKKLILQKAFSGELTSPPSQAIKEAAE